jgi:hypothetical protein
MLAHKIGLLNTNFSEFAKHVGGAILSIGVGKTGKTVKSAMSVSGTV